MNSHPPRSTRTAAPVSTDAARRRVRLVTIVFGVACGLAFVILGVLVHDHLPAVDRWALDSAVTEAGSTQELVATIVSTIAVLFGLAVLLAVAVRAWWRQSRWLVRLSWCGALLLTCGVPLTLQNVFQRPGPPGQPDSFSYPSGHATVAGAVAATAAVIAAVFVRKWFRRVLALQSLAVLLTMASRVTLAEHYVTDVIGAVLGVASIALLSTALVRPLWTHTLEDSPPESGPAYARSETGR